MIEMSQNALRRAQQRGISRDTVEMVGRLADRKFRVPGGAVALSLSPQARQRCISEGHAAAQVERTKNIVLIADQKTRTVITVQHGHRHGQLRN